MVSFSSFLDREVLSVKISVKKGGAKAEASRMFQASHLAARSHPARRGATIIEALLYLSVAAGVVAFSGQILQTEQNRQRNQIVASDVQSVVDATQLFVAQTYDGLVADLVAQTTTGSSMLAEFGLEKLVDAGFLPAIYVNGPGGLLGVYGQTYSILHRAVLRSDPSNTISKTNAIEARLPELTDGVFSEDGSGTVTNDELDLEVILVSAQRNSEGLQTRPIEPQNGTRIVELAGRPAIGFVPPRMFWDDSGAAVARGAFKGWELSLSAYNSLPSAPVQEGGVIAALISLPVTGVVSVLVDARDTENLSRCADIPPNTQAHGDCIASSSGNQLFTDLVFNAWDSDGDGALDKLPALTGLHKITLGDPVDADGDGTLESFPDIEGVQRIEFRGAVETELDSNGNPITGSSTLYSEVSNLFALSCHAADGSPTAPANTPQQDEFQINCPATKLSGTLVASSASIDTLTATTVLDVKGSLTIGGISTFNGDTTFANTSNVTFAGNTNTEGTATMAHAVVGEDGLSVSGSSTFNDVTLNGNLFVGSVETDLLEKLPVWTEIISFPFSPLSDFATASVEIDIENASEVSNPFSGSCPSGRVKALEYVLMGYSFIDPPSSPEIENTKIAQIGIADSSDRLLIVRMSGKWADDITVRVLAQVYCRLSS